MKDLINLAVYGLGTLAVILILIYGARIESFSSNAIGIFAIIAVVIAPVAIGLILAKRERKDSEEDA